MSKIILSKKHLARETEDVLVIKYGRTVQTRVSFFSEIILYSIVLQCHIVQCFFKRFQLYTLKAFYLDSELIINAFNLCIM